MGQPCPRRLTVTGGNVRLDRHLEGLGSRSGSIGLGESPSWPTSQMWNKSLELQCYCTSASPGELYKDKYPLSFRDPDSVAWAAHSLWKEVTRSLTGHRVVNSGTLFSLSVVSHTPWMICSSQGNVAIPSPGISLEKNV